MVFLLGIGIVVVLLIIGISILLTFTHDSMENTAKNFALQLGSLVSLYVSITGLIMVLFNVITIQYPDVAAQGYWEYESAASGLRFAIAMLIVFFPAYIVLTRLVNNVRRNEHGTYLMLTKWLIYLSLLIGGATLLGDLVAVIFNYLNGELTIRFILKALAFLVVIGAAFTYYLFDARGYWQTHEKHSIQYGAGAALIVILVLILGFMNTKAPAEVREMKIDQQQITDLSVIQSRVYDYYQVNGKLPASMEAAFSGVPTPVASAGRDSYTYTATSDTSFSICAGFAYPSSQADQAQYAATPLYIDGGIKNSENWDHGKDNWCFERVINAAAPVKLLNVQ